MILFTIAIILVGFILLSVLGGGVRKRARGDVRKHGKIAEDERPKNEPFWHRRREKDDDKDDDEDGDRRRDGRFRGGGGRFGGGGASGDW